MSARWYHRLGMTPSSQNKLTALLIASLLTLAATACKPGDKAAGGQNAAGASAAASGLTVSVAADGAAVGPAVVRVEARDGGAPLTGAEVEVRGDMTHAGMAPVLVTAGEAEPGVYVAAGFTFTMAGDWIVSATVTAADGREATAETFVTVGR